MGDIIELGGFSPLDVSVEKVIKSAEAALETAVIVGWDREGELYFASSKADKFEVLWLLEQAKKRLLTL